MKEIEKKKDFTLDEMFKKVCNNDITENEFIFFLRSQDISPVWLEMELKDAYSKIDTEKISYLLNCIYGNSFRFRPDITPVTSLFCKIMEDPRCAMLAEEIADALGYCVLDKSALRSFVNVCTSPYWEETDWPDLRKALESMYAMYASKVCGKEEVIAAFREIIESPHTVNEWRGIRDTAGGFIEKIQQEAS